MSLAKTESNGDIRAYAYFARNTARAWRKKVPVRADFVFLFISIVKVTVPAWLHSFTYVIINICILLFLTNFVNKENSQSTTILKPGTYLYGL